MQRSPKSGILGQLRPSNTTAASLYSPAQNTEWRAETLIICNTSGSTATARVFHDEDGSTYDESTALFWNVQLIADETVIITNFKVLGESTLGNVGVRSSVGNALTFSLYGTEIR